MNSIRVARASVIVRLVTATSICDAAAAKSYFDLPEAERSASVGDTAAALAAADVVVEGVAEIGGQAHFYMEQQNATASPTEGGGIELVCSTQSANQTSSVVATALQKSPAQVRTSVRRVGGAYGGKITRKQFALTVQLLHQQVWLEAPAGSRTTQAPPARVLLGCFDLVDRAKVSPTLTPTHNPG